MYAPFATPILLAVREMIRGDRSGIRRVSIGAPVGVGMGRPPPGGAGVKQYEHKTDARYMRRGAAGRR